jgi:hypothetical protein
MISETPKIVIYLNIFPGKVQKDIIVRSNYDLTIPPTSRIIKTYEKLLNMSRGKWICSRNFAV